MKQLIMTFLLLFTANAWSMGVYNCDVTATPKMGDRTQAWTKKLFLSQAFTNKVTFNDTALELRLDVQGNLNGSVNGQPNFILTGDAFNGAFESAYHTGEIKCDVAQNVSHLFLFKPWGQFFSVDSKLSVGHIRNDLNVSSLKYSHICFIGDVKEAFKAASDAMKVKGNIKSIYEMTFTWNDTFCARGTGSSVDDWTCYEYKTETRTDSIPHCFDSENDRP